jgi:hypothetical protein
VPANDCSGTKAKKLHVSQIQGYSDIKLASFPADIPDAVLVKRMGGDI